MKKVINSLIIIKRIILVSVTLWILSTVWRLEILRQKAINLSLACAQMLEQRLASVEEKMGNAAASFESVSFNRGTKSALSGQPMASLKGLLAVSGYMEEVAWVAGSGRDSMGFVKRGGGIEQKTGSAAAANGPLSQAHHKGRVVVSPLEYTAKSIPIFHLSYPLDIQEGGFLVTRINLWEFLKLPTVLAQEMLGTSFEFEIKDSQGKLLAHKAGRLDPLGKLATRFLTSRSQVKRLNIEVQLTPTRQALFDTLKPGKLIWWCLGAAIVLCFFL